LWLRHTSSPSRISSLPWWYLAGTVAGLCQAAAMGAFLGQFARTCYGVTLAINMLWTTALMNIVYLIPMGRKWHQGMCLVLTQLGWRIALLFAPWVKCQGDDDYVEQWSLVLSLMADYQADAAREGKPPRPLFILGNHASFFDTVLAVAKFPVQVVWRVRTYMSNHLFKLPVLSTICKSVGHFPVHFTSSESGKFKVDAEKMEAVEKSVDAHLKDGGWLCFFPEGQMNKEPDKILPFRFGGMKRALEFDAALVMLVFRGNTDVWPLKAQVGGFPGRVRYSLRTVAMDGAKAFVEMARSEGNPEEKDMPDHEILARRAQELMQAQYDALGDERQSGISSLQGRMKNSAKKD